MQKGRRGPGREDVTKSACFAWVSKAWPSITRPFRCTASPPVPPPRAGGLPAPTDEERFIGSWLAAMERLRCGVPPGTLVKAGVAQTCTTPDESHSPTLITPIRQRTDCAGEYDKRPDLTGMETERATAVASDRRNRQASERRDGESGMNEPTDRDDAHAVPAPRNPSKAAEPRLPGAPLRAAFVAQRWASRVSSFRRGPGASFCEVGRARLRGHFAVLPYLVYQGWGDLAAGCGTGSVPQMKGDCCLTAGAREAIRRSAKKKGKGTKG